MSVASCRAPPNDPPFPHRRPAPLLFTPAPAPAPAPAPTTMSSQLPTHELKVSPNGGPVDGHEHVPDAKAGAQNGVEVVVR